MVVYINEKMRKLPTGCKGRANFPMPPRQRPQGDEDPSPDNNPPAQRRLAA